MNINKNASINVRMSFFVSFLHKKSARERPSRADVDIKTVRLSGFSQWLNSVPEIHCIRPGLLSQLYILVII